jgi:hypothetical protein
MGRSIFMIAAHEWTSESKWCEMGSDSVKSETEPLSSKQRSDLTESDPIFDSDGLTARENAVLQCGNPRKIRYNWSIPLCLACR